MKLSLSTTIIASVYLAYSFGFVPKQQNEYRIPQRWQHKAVSDRSAANFADTPSEGSKRFTKQNLKLPELTTCQNLEENSDFFDEINGIQWWRKTTKAFAALAIIPFLLAGD
jgi:hypothetical protein